MCDAGYVGYTRGHLHERVDGHKQKSSSICKHYLSEHNSDVPPFLSEQFHVLTKGSNKFDCLIKEMLFIRKLKPSLNVHTDSIRAKVFTWRTCYPLLLCYFVEPIQIKSSHYLFILPWEWYHNLLNMWKKISVYQQLVFLFWAMSFAKLSNLCLRMISRENPETIQSERTLASWYVPANSIAVFVLTWDEQQCSLCHKIFCSCFFLVRLLESSKLRKNLRRCSRSRRASWNCILRGVFNAQTTHVLKTCHRLAEQWTLPCRPIPALYLQISNFTGYT